MPSPSEQPHSFLPSQAAGEKIARLDEENTQLRQAVDSHAVIDQAIGVLIAVHQLPADVGWNVLREISQHRNIKLHAVAEEIIDWALGRPMSQVVGRELTAAVLRWRPTAQAEQPEDHGSDARAFPH